MTPQPQPKRSPWQPPRISRLDVARARSGIDPIQGDGQGSFGS